MPCDLYVITDTAIGRGRSHEEIARLAVAGGADIIQFRDKAMGTQELIETGRRMAAIAQGTGTLFIVNDRPDVAIACGAHGVHLGQGDAPVAQVRRTAPEGFIIGVSAGTGKEAAAAVADGADYIAASPVFPTLSKTDTPTFCGLSGVREIRAAVRVPLIAIGGIHRGNIPDVIAAGADGIAVISAVIAQPDITGAARDLKAEVIRAKKRAGRPGTPFP